MPQKHPAPTSLWPDARVFVPGAYPIPAGYLPATHPFLKTFSCGHRREPRAERSPRLQCLACENQDRRNRRHWAALSLVALLMLALVALRCSSG
jgi:hypothetical protein